jgi:hypothetical protein
MWITILINTSHPTHQTLLYKRKKGYRTIWDVPENLFEDDTSKALMTVRVLLAATAKKRTNQDKDFDTSIVYLHQDSRQVTILTQKERKKKKDLFSLSYYALRVPMVK